MDVSYFVICIYAEIPHKFKKFGLFAFKMAAKMAKLRSEQQILLPAAHSFYCKSLSLLYVSLLVSPRKLSQFAI